MEKTRILLSDPQVLFREGMHFTLSAEEDMEVTGETTNNEEALAFVEAEPPNIVLLNISNGELDGPTASRQIKRNFPSVAVIMVIDKDEEELLFATVKCGASAYLSKDSNPDYLLDLIRVVAQGSQPIIECVLMPSLASRILKEFEVLSPLSEQLPNVLARLSIRESEILGSIAVGNNLEQIAISLNCNEGTIRKHLRSILNKLVANEQTRAVIDVAQRGLPPLVPGVDLTAEYVTRKEFNEFKESLMQRFRSLTRESS